MPSFIHSFVRSLNTAPRLEDHFQGVLFQGLGFQMLPAVPWILDGLLMDRLCMYSKAGVPDPRAADWYRSVAC